MKLYISGPISGYAVYNRTAFFNAERILKDLGYETLNPFDSDLNADLDLGIVHSWETYLKDDLKMMLDADGVCVLKGWECSAGAKLEVDTAMAVKIPVHTLEHWAESANLFVVSPSKILESVNE